LWHFHLERGATVLHFDDSATNLLYAYLPNAGDDNDSFNSVILTLETADYLYIGCPVRFNYAWVNMGGTVNAVAATMVVQYFTGRSWNGVSGLTDGTASGGATLAQDGAITFNLPTTHETGFDDGNADFDTWPVSSAPANYYWIRLQPSANLTTSLIVNEIYLKNTITPEDMGRFIALPKAKDGDLSIAQEVEYWEDNDYLYIGHASPFDQIQVNLGSVNNNAAVLSAQFMNGSAWATLTITTDGTALAGATMGQDGTVSFTAPYNWVKASINGAEAYWVRLKTSADLDPLTFVEISVIYTNNYSVNIPTLAANRWIWCLIDITPSTYPPPDFSAIASLGLQLTLDLGAMNIDLLDGFQLVAQGLEYVEIGDGHERINGLERYGDERENPWIFTDGGIFEIQTQNDDSVVPLPLREVDTQKSENNGRASTTNGVYLYFSMGNHLERYYQHNLDDVGPDRDLGLPSERQGQVSALLSYPGAVYAAIDAGGSGYSSILARQGSGWHEVYRAPLGERIKAMAAQVVPNMATRLWIAQGSDVLWLALPTKTFNPYTDSVSRYFPEGYLTTSWVTVGMLDILKLLTEVKLFTENLSAGARFIRVEYQLETGALTSGWTRMGNIYDVSPFESAALSATYNVTARRIRFRFILSTSLAIYTPLLKSWLLETLVRLKVKYSYTFLARVADNQPGMDQIPDPNVRAETVFAQVDTWGDAPTALLFRCAYSPFDNKYVVVEPPGAKPTEIVMADNSEAHVVEITLLEI